MRNKAPLTLMEQLVMLLVFALAAALCLQVFVLSDQLSRRCEERDRAVVVAQNAAEIMKTCKGNIIDCSGILGGSVDGSAWKIGYDVDWQQTALDQAAYQILVVPVASATKLLGTAEVCAQTIEGELLFQLTVSWQEVDAHG